MVQIHLQKVENKMYNIRIIMPIVGYEDVSKPYEFMTDDNIKTIYYKMVSHLRRCYRSYQRTRYIVTDEKGDCILWGYVRRRTSGTLTACLNKCGKYGGMKFNW